MKYLKLFENFDESDTLYIFDFDDTLVKSPSFEELVIRYLNGKYSSEIEYLLKKPLALVNKSINDLIPENGKIFVKDDTGLEPKKPWVRKGNGLKLTTPNRFHSMDISFGNTVKEEIASIYRRVKNKVIVTGRKSDLKDKVSQTLINLGLEIPYKDLHCFPYGNDTSDRVADWKARTIVELLKNSNFKKSKFYDDNPKWVRRVVMEVRRELPDVEFEGIRVY